MRTHEQMIAAKWFSEKTLSRIFPAENLNDKITNGIAHGAYGMNALEKISAHRGKERADAARKLAHAALFRDELCPVCKTCDNPGF